ncbi:MAG: DUF1304 domain-containing protein [Acidobacteriota bacterium]
MELIANIATAVVALLHAYILVLEMFLWNRAVKVFGVPREHRDNALMKTMMKNQGLYNGFLAAGLAWGLFHPDPAVGFQIKLFFLACVAVAGLYGAATAKVQILFIQTVPAVIAAGLLILAR